MQIAAGACIVEAFPLGASLPTGRTAVEHLKIVKSWYSMPWKHKNRRR